MVFLFLLGSCHLCHRQGRGSDPSGGHLCDFDGRTPTGVAAGGVVPWKQTQRHWLNG